MQTFFSSLELSVVVILLLSLALVLAFEFINGFHDTANTVATVIYTKSMKPGLAVFLSGVFNFFGVFLGGLAVAYAIIHLFPLDLLTNITPSKGLVLVFSLLVSAIIWNLGTWYFGIPASSSHTLIGSILGVGLAHAVLSGQPLRNGVNWSKATDVFLSLLLSPFIGGGLAAGLVLILIFWKRNSYIHKTPYQRHEIEGRKRPPFWPRFVLICSAMAMSFAHGSNDGQKGVGLIMLVLFSLVPGHFVLNMNTNSLEIEQIRTTIRHFQSTIEEHHQTLKLNPTELIQTSSFTCQHAKALQHSEHILATLGEIQSFKELSLAQRWQVRNELTCLASVAQRAQSNRDLPNEVRSALHSVRHSLNQITQYAPFWVIFLVALALGLGTMIGWRRVVETVGSKIGKKHMTYAQGISAQVMAGTSIGLASHFGFPVSTTHILSSAVAGTMVANKAGLQWSTVRTIFSAWVLTLPVAMGMSFGFYWLGAKLFLT